MAKFKFNGGMKKLIVPGEGAFGEHTLTVEMYERLKAKNPKLVSNIQLIQEDVKKESTK